MLRPPIQTTSVAATGYLKLFPEWEPQMEKVSDIFPEWILFVSRWSEMTTLFEMAAPSGACPKLYALMKSLGRLS
jgi:hypothetical protein